MIGDQQPAEATGDLPTLEQVRAAAARIAPLLHRTPLVRSETLSRMAGCEVFLKCENLQKTGSFKPRGAINRITTLDDGARGRGVITISAGNHAQGVAFASARLGVHALVVMPETADPGKVAATRAYGAECVLHGDVHAAFEKMQELQDERGLTLVHPFDDAELMAGQGTVGLEMAEEEELDVVIVGVGGGGLIGGVATALAELAPRTRIFGVEPEGAATMSAAIAAGAPQRIEVDTIADGLAPPFAGALGLAVARRHIKQMVTVTDDQIRSAMVLLLERCKMLVEPGGAAATAALMERIVAVPSGARVGIVLSGGNIGVSRLRALLASP